MPELTLTSEEVRVLGALLEKDLATPEYYPLSLNALVNACNQKSNRDPVVEYSEDIVRAALLGLQERGLAGQGAHDGRVAKFGHRFGEVFNLGRGELALICVLLLRGAQTPGELRSRTERMHRFDDLESLDGCLRRLEERQPEPLARELHRQPGQKETRYRHLFSSEADPPLPVPVSRDRLSQLVEEVAALRGEFEAFKKKFE
jgi:hypothetical protein